MQRYNITVPKKYIKDGVEKSSWKQVGQLLRFPAKDGKEENFAIEMHMFPDTKFGVFLDEPKTGSKESILPDYNQEEEPIDSPF